MDELDEKLLVKHLSVPDGNSSLGPNDNKDSFEGRSSISSDIIDTTKEAEKHVEPVKSPAEQKLFKKINKRFAPFLVCLLFFQFCDKTTLSVAAILPEFYQDTNITQDQYSWVSSIFYLGYLSMQLPNNFMMQRYPVSKYLGTILVIWGVALLSMAWAKSFGQLAALRFLLGFFEAVTYPCMFLLIATLYRRSEQIIWMGVMFMSNGFAGIVGILIGVGILQMPTVGTISPWKWCMILFGAVTILMGIIYFMFLPDKPTSKWFNLTEEEEFIVEERVRDNAVVPTRTFNWDHVYEAIKEPRLYLYSLVSFFINFQNGALTTFSTIIIKDLGYSGMNSILLNIPSGVATVLLIAIFTYVSKKKSETLYVAMAANTVSLIGCILLAAIPNGGPKLIGLYLSWSAAPTHLLTQASITSNVAGYTKKNFYTAVNMIFYTCGNFVGPLLLREEESPRYLTGMCVYIGANCLSLACLFVLRLMYVKANKKRLRNCHGNENVALEGELQDITDAQNYHYIYRT